ncbi:MAG: flagellar transcriptional regulator FlhC [Candidatus Thiodiazotropha sp. (ex Ctena orbiculata)]|uniref:Flagellar transcriptional regulator FlhC n=1 Tax=Candidatus Thiodiazotropha taylori TaxID=2792791 RepID=A0A944M7U1_9GAMM|nr:flagellar transcriptional regulator FlhC [Candidatus Thiodiazotropha taylori]
MEGGKSDQLLALITGSGSEASALGKIEFVNQARNALDAVRLIQLGARAALVCQLTGLTKKAVTSLYPLLIDKQSRPGQAPFTDTWYLKSNQRMLHANVVWRLYQHLEEIGHSAARVLIHVYETYTQIMGAPLLTLSRAFFVPRLVAINEWYEQTCDHCGIAYIGPLGNDGSTCPACAEYFRYRCRCCGAPLEYLSSGRWKGICCGCHERPKQGKKINARGGFNGNP